MKKIICPLFILMIAACNNSTTNAGSATSDLTAAKADIAESNKTYGDGFAKGDSAAFISHYTKDACIMPANSPKICGTQGITAFFNGGIGMGIKNIKITTDEVMGGPELVTETGTYELMADSSKVIDKGKFVVTWKAEDGKWKMFRDIWTTDMPLMPTK